MSVTIVTLCVGSKLQSQCPWTCVCTDDNNIITVKCKSRFWTTVPPLPVNTSVLKIIKPDTAQLRSHVFFNAHGLHLHNIVLGKVSARTVDKDAFWGLHELQSLSIGNSNIEHLPNETFMNLHKLNVLRLGRSKLEQIPTAICQLTGLGQLYLLQSNITSARLNHCFENLTGLSILSLAGSPLSQIRKEDFHALRMTNLKVLRLGNCKLKSLDPDVFHYLPHLTNVDLGNNNLDQIDPNLFSLQPYLEALYIHGNRFKTVPSKFLSHIPRLRQLNLGDNKLKTLNFGAEFLNLRKLQMLDVGKNHLEVLYNHTFDNLVNSWITQLVLDTCKLHSIEAASFSPLRHLEEVTLSFNPINASSLETAFYGLGNAIGLTKLTIMGTNLRDLNNTTFRYLSNTSVTTLTAQKILVPHLHSHVFQYLPQLQNLNLRGSDLRDIGVDAFVPLTNLKTLQLDNNKLVDLPIAYKTGLTTLKSLSVTGNLIKYLTATNCMGYFALETFFADNCAITKIKSKAFNDMKKLEHLTLYMNKIAYTHQDAFIGLDNLKVLRLSHNNLVLTEASSTMFGFLGTLQKLGLAGNTNIAHKLNLMKVLLSNLTNLNSLDLTSTGLSELPFELLGNLSMLTRLQLSSNHISYWNPRVFKNLHRIELLTMRNNTITLLNQTSLHYLKSLRHLDLSGNPFSCTCDLMWFRNWIYSSSVYIEGLGPAYRCATPQQMRNVPLVNFKLSTRECMDLTDLYTMAGLTLTYAILVTAISLMYRYRWYIR